jgi:hypothetical protein
MPCHFFRAGVDFFDSDQTLTRYPWKPDVGLIVLLLKIENKDHYVKIQVGVMRTGIQAAETLVPILNANRASAIQIIHKASQTRQSPKSSDG